MGRSGFRATKLAWAMCWVSVFSPFLCAEAPAQELAEVQIGPEAELSIGGGASDPLHEVRGVVLLPDGGVVIGEGSTNTIRFYSSDGSLRFVHGRTGRGPGEYTGLMWVRGYNGRIYASDPHVRRLSWYDLDGLFGGSVPVRPFGGYPSADVVGVFSDGSLLVATSRSPTRVRSPGAVRSERALFVFNEDGSLRDSVGVFKSDEVWRAPWGNGGHQVAPMPLGRRSGVVVHGSRYYVLENEDATIGVFNMSGEPVASLDRVDHGASRPVRPSDIRLMRDRLLGMEGDRDVFAELFDGIAFPDMIPDYGWASWERRPILVGSPDALWALNFGGLDEEPPRWVRFGYYGGVSLVAAPHDVELWDVNEDRAAVLRRGPYGEEIVEIRRIFRE